MPPPERPNPPIRIIRWFRDLRRAPLDYISDESPFEDQPSETAENKAVNQAEKRIHLKNLAESAKNFFHRY